ELCICANNVLAEHMRRLTDRITVLPLGLDGTRWRRKAAIESSAVVRVGWSGHPVNLPYLEAIEPALVQAQSENPQIEFAIFCGKAPNFRKHLRTGGDCAASRKGAIAGKPRLKAAPQPQRLAQLIAKARPAAHPMTAIEFIERHAIQVSVVRDGWRM